MRYLYKKSYHCRKDMEYGDFLKQCSVKILSPKPFALTFKGENISLTMALGRLYFWFITFGKYKVYYLYYNDNVVHTSYVIPKCFKFPFLHKKDYEIGPCVTNSSYRRKGSYYYMLDYITTSKEFEGSDFYMIVSAANEASVKGIEKAGFERCGSVVKSKILMRYELEK